jgi:hypothetical protein
MTTTLTPGRSSVRTVVVNQLLDITHDLRVPAACDGGHAGQQIAALIVGGSRLGVEDEWYGQQALRRVIFPASGETRDGWAEGGANFDPFNLQRARFRQPLGMADWNCSVSAYQLISPVGLIPRNHVTSAQSWRQAQGIGRP